MHTVSIGVKAADRLPHCARWVLCPQDPDGFLENSDFVETDIPYDFELPTHAHVSDAAHDEVRDWVLAVSMDQQVEQSLASRSCSSCGTDTYAGSLVCHACQSASDMCVVSGGPIPIGERQVVKGVDPPMFVRKADWNRFVGEFGVDPWSGLVASPSY